MTAENSNFYKKVLKSLLFEPSLVSQPGSWVGHFPFMNWLIGIVKPSIYVELGVHSGNSYFCVCKSVIENQLITQCYGIDLWTGDEHSGFYTDEVYRKVSEHNDKNYKQFSRLFKMSFDEALPSFDNGSISLLHIDGLHTYEAVSHDFKMWLPKMSKDGIIIFHDVCVRENDFGVYKLWDELKNDPSYCCTEFQHSAGLGVLCLNRNRDLFGTISDGDKAFVIRLFEEMGSKHTNKCSAEFYALHLKKLENAYIDLQESNSAVQIENEKLMDHCAYTESVNNLLNIQLNQVRSSRSWKVTSPLRFFGRTYRKVRNALGQTKAFARRIVYTIKYAHSFRDGVSKLRLLIIESYATHHISNINNYDLWYKRYDVLTNLDIARIQLKTNALLSKPKISVLMPVYNPNLDWLRQAIESVKSQIYTNWELCIVDDKSTDIRVSKIINDYAADDSRIKILLRDNNGHICRASNSALQISTGDWIAFLDQDDMLRPHSLYMVAQVINEKKCVKLIYSDEDKISSDNKRSNPYFKPDWNKELFYSHNLVTHLAVYDAGLLRSLGGLRVGFEGAQDYDLVLRCIESITENQIHHIPHILYHWRMHANSTSQNIFSKEYAIDAGLRALREHFYRINRDVTVNVNQSYFMYEVNYKLPDKLPLVTIIIPTRNKLELIKNCISALLKRTTYSNFEILIVDNDSDDQETLEFLKNISKENCLVRVLRYVGEFNYSAINNMAVRHANGDYLCLMNNDIEVVSNDWLAKLMSYALDDNVGAVGCKLLYPNNTIQHAGVILGIGGVAGHSHKNFPETHPGYFNRIGLASEISAVTAACLVVKRSKYEEVGGLNQRDLKVAFNDVDFCLKLKQAGYKNIYVSDVKIYHHESASRGHEDNPQKIARFKNESAYMQKSWASYLNSDTAYNPNLTIRHEDFTLAWPPRKRMVEI